MQRSVDETARAAGRVAVSAASLNRKSCDPRARRPHSAGRASRPGPFLGHTPAPLVRARAARHEPSAHQLAAAYATRELSRGEVARAALARIDAWEPKINAMYRVAREAALEQARGAEARWRVRAPLSVLEVESEKRIGANALGCAWLFRCDGQVDLQPASRLHERGGPVRGGRQQQKEARRATSWRRRSTGCCRRYGR